MNGEQKAEQRGGFAGGVAAQLLLRQAGQQSQADGCCGTSGVASVGCCGEVATSEATSCCGEPITLVAAKERATSGGCCG